MPLPPDTKSDASEIHADEQPTGSHRRHWNPAGLIVVVIGIAVCVTVLGLVLRNQPEAARVSNTGVTDAESTEQAFADQVASVQAGESTRLQFTDTAISDRLLLDLPVESLASLDTVIVDQGAVTDEGLAVIARLPGLEQLRLRHSPITDAGVALLANCEQIWLVNLPQSRVSSVGLASLQKRTKLKQLRIGSPLLGDDCCHAIAELKSLRGLHLIDVPVTDAGLKVLATLPHLESLYLDDSEVTEAGWDWLFQERPQLHVHVNQQHHDRDPHTHPH